METVDSGLTVMFLMFLIWAGFLTMPYWSRPIYKYKRARKRRKSR